MFSNQEEFERNILFESSLYQENPDITGNIVLTTLDTLKHDSYHTLDSIILGTAELNIEIEEVRTVLISIILDKINKLNKLEREILGLYYYKDKTERDIAIILNKSKTSIHFHLNKIKKVLYNWSS